MRICIFLPLAGIPIPRALVRALHQQLRHDPIAFTQYLFYAEAEIGEAGDPAGNITGLTTVSAVTPTYSKTGFERPGGRVEVDVRDRSWVAFVPNLLPVG